MVSTRDQAYGWDLRKNDHSWPMPVPTRDLLHNARERLFDEPELDIATNRLIGQ